MDAAITYVPWSHWCASCIVTGKPAESGLKPGCILTVLADVAVSPEFPIAPKKSSLLPLLIFLFLVSYGLMTLLIVEQGSTIETQRGLIREMLHDSVELSAMKGKAIEDKNRADAQSHAHAPSAQTPSSQTPMIQTPSSQVAPGHNTRNQASKMKPRLQAPARPASDLADERRAVMTI